MSQTLLTLVNSTLNFVQVFIPSRCSLWDFPSGSVVKNLPALAIDTREEGLIPSQEDPLEEEMAVFLPEKSHGQRSLASYSS